MVSQKSEHSHPLAAYRVIKHPLGATTEVQNQTESGYVETWIADN
ncbi:hypothetical protein [Paraburkholderia sp. SIMBA_027]